MGVLAIIGSFLKMVATALGLIQRNEEKSEDFQIAKAADLTAVTKEQQGAEVIAESVGQLSDDELNRRLRQSQSGG